MSRISRQKEKYGSGNELSRDNSNEGTAARTRPFSFEEIMLRRRNKKLTAYAKEGAGDQGKLSGKDNVENVYDHSEPDGGYRHNKDSNFGVISEDTVKGSSRKKVENTPSKEGNLVKGKGKESHDSEANLMDKLDKDMSSRAKGGKTEKLSHHRSRNDERSRDDFENESDKKRSENSLGKEKYGDRERGKYERESKRKHRSGDDEKNRSEIDVNAVKKHDSGKWHDSEPAERKGRKKESSQSHYQEAKPKKRRSRSPETRDRDRKSVSLSPRANKRISYHGREHGESSFHSFKDRRQHSDVDRSRMSSNGGYASSHYRRHGGHGSRLGGYSPRKRRTEAAVKTPSPTIRSPERKSAGWDLPPTGTGTISTGSILSNFQSSHQTVSSSAPELPSAVPVTLNIETPQSGASPNTVSTKKNVSTDSIQLTQATRPLRRLYVENVPASASDKSIMESLNNFLLPSGINHIQVTQPCISCIINKDKAQALVEFLTPEDATIALSFDGRSFSGSILKIRRPKDFFEAATGVREKPVAAVHEISDIVKDSPHKIFVGGISKALSSDMLMEIVSAFGLLKAYRFQVNEDFDEPSAFLEYVDQSITLKACAGLNGMKLGGQVLTVVQAAPNAFVEENTERPPFYGIPEHAKSLLSKPTNVLMLKNVFNREDLILLSGPELEETLEDIRLECARFGTVKSINIVRYDSSCATAPEAFEVTNQTDVRRASQDADAEVYTKKTETTEDDIISGENSRPEPPKDSREHLDDGDVEDNRTSDDKPEDLLVRDGSSEPCQLYSTVAPEVPTCHPNTDATPQQSPALLDTTEDQSAFNDDNCGKVSNSSMGNSLMVEKELKTEEANGKLQDAPIESNDVVRRESDISEKGESKQQANDIDDGFEQGCVLVEYARTEASCMAAHCLHGRLYGDWIVEVGYIAQDLYLSRFPK